MTAPAITRLYALVPCAGVGERAGPGGPKQYRPLGARTVVGHTLAALQAVQSLAGVLVVVAPDDALFAQCAPEHRGWLAAVGGATRAQSVAHGLQALRTHGAHDADWVLVHDAARCLVRPADIERLIAACRADPVGGLLALPVADTLKRAADDGRHVATTVARAGLWQAQTPQMFRLGVLQQALAAACGDVTDEASAIEALGHAPLLVHGRLDNFKLTWPDDFALAEQVLASRQAAR